MGVLILGTAFADSISTTSSSTGVRSTAGDDTIQAFGGVDFVRAGGGDDSVDGGADGDQLFGEDGSDSILGGDGDDVIGDDGINSYFFLGNDVFGGGNGNDLLDGGLGDDILFGGAGRDTLVGGPGVDQFAGLDFIGVNFGLDFVSYDSLPFAGDGPVGAFLASAAANTGAAAGDTYLGIRGLIGSRFNDTLGAALGASELRGDLGADLLIAGPGADTIGGGGDQGDAVSYEGSATGVLADLRSLVFAFGDAAGDLVTGVTDVIGSAFNDSIGGTDFNDRLSGSEGGDYLSGYLAFDDLFGGDGDDSLEGGLGFDLLEGGDGNDRIADTEGVLLVPGAAPDKARDTLRGGEGDDILTATKGNDLLEGGEGADSVEGGRGNDSLHGGLGADSLRGGDGADDFVFAGAAEGGDVIRDFVAFADDIVVSAAGFGGGLIAGRSLAKVNGFVAGTVPTAANGQFLYDEASGVLLWDADGSGAEAAVTIARLGQDTVLVSGDINVIA